MLRCSARFEIASTRLEYELTLESRERDEERESKKRRRNIDIPRFHPRRGTSCFSRGMFIGFSKSLPKLTPNVRKGASSTTLYLILHIYPNSQRTFRSGRSRDATIYLHMLFCNEGITLSHDILSVEGGPRFITDTFTEDYRFFHPRRMMESQLCSRILYFTSNLSLRRNIHIYKIKQCLRSC